MKNALSPAPLSDEELARGTQLQTEYDRLLKQWTSLAPEPLREAREEADQNFLELPTAENFARLKTAAIEREVLGRLGTDNRVRGFARQAVINFRRDSVIPWARPIMERALDKAREALRGVTEREAARHIEMTGEPMQNSSIVEVAKRPLKKLQQFMESFFSDASPVGYSPKIFIAFFQPPAKADQADFDPKGRKP